MSTPVINAEYVQALMASVFRAPFPHLIGLQLGSIDFDSATITLDVAGHHLQPFGIVHGGVLATLIDTATFWSAFMRLPQDAGLVNIDLKLNYLQTVRGGRLTTVGRCIRPGKTISYAEAHVYDDQGGLLAHGTSTLMSLPGRGLDIGLTKFLDGAPPANG